MIRVTQTADAAWLRDDDGTTLGPLTDRELRALAADALEVADDLELRARGRDG